MGISRQNMINNYLIKYTSGKIFKVKLRKIYLKVNYGIETCILSCKNQITSLCPMQDTACLGLVHGDDPEGRCGEGGGRGFMFQIACTPVVDSCQCMAKPIQYFKVK